MAPLFVEILDRRRQVAERVRIDDLPATVGRSYSGDVIVDDPFVCPQHLLLERRPDGGVVIRDTSDVNGLVDTRTGRRVESLDIEDEAVVQVGGTLLRVRSRGFGIEPARPYPGAAKVAAKGVPDWALTTAMLLGSLVFLSWREFLGSTQEFSVAEQMESVVGWSVALGLWTGLWSFAGSALVHQPCFGRHLRIASIGIVALHIWDTALSYGTFFLALDTWPELLAASGYAAISAAILYHHLALVSRHARRRLIIVGCTATLIVAGTLFSHLASRNDFVGYPEYAAVLKPIPPKLLKADSAAALFESATDLRDEVDRLAAAED